MEPVTIVVTALATGAAAAAKSTVETAVKDAYAAFKSLIRRKYDKVDVAPIEAKPESQAKRDSVAEDLKDAGAEQDAELLEAARKLIELIQSRAPEAGPAIGVDLERVSAAALRIHEVESEGTGVRVRDAQIAGDIDISGVRSGNFTGGDKVGPVGPGKRPNP